VTGCPPQRAIAEAPGVDLTTVTRAFNEARRRSLVDAQAGRGTFIREGGGPHYMNGRPRAVVDLSMNAPPQPSSPRGALTPSYQESNGAGPDRYAAAWLRRRIEQVEEGQILITAGAQSALFAL
jgi:DNA-binding transcriptional MocR family regulator